MNAMLAPLLLVLSAAAPTNDPVMSAMREELARVPTLKTDALPAPYFASYSVHDVEQTAAFARFGALVGSGVERGRVLSPNIRIGAHEFDATGFPTNPEYMRAPWEDDYDALRHQLWLVTDDVYKTGVQQYEGAIAERKQTTRSKDEPASWSREKPHTYIEPADVSAAELADHEALAKQLSAVFRDHAQIHESEARVMSLRVRRRFASSEGSEIDDTETLALVMFGARTQAEDGSMLGDGRVFVARDFAGLPDKAKLVAAAHEVAKSLEALRTAPVVDDFAGPVLFEGRAAVQVVAHGFVSQIVAPPFAGAGEIKLGKRLLPASFSVIDDPTLTELEGTRLLGHYAVDDQGVPAQRVELVRKGKQTDVLRGRAPTRERPQSNGHARGSWPGMTMVSPGNVIVRSEGGLSKAALEKRLVAHMKKDGHDHAFIVRDLGADAWSPIEVYRVDRSGKRQRVRVDRMQLPREKDFARIVAAGNELTIENMLTNGGHPGGFGGGIDSATVTAPASIAAPSLLFDNVEIARSEGDRPKPPLYPHPHFAK
jgi:TldD protein